MEYIKSLNISYKENTRLIIGPQEIDIYISSHNLAIEFNGTYWHSQNFKLNKWYHQFKVEKCHRLGIRLLHIYEWEWKNDRQKCLDKINYYLNNNEAIKSRKPIPRFVQNNIEVEWKTLNKNNKYFLIFD